MNVPTDFENLIKILILGDASVGKSNFIFRFIEDNYTENYMPTVGFDYKSKLITLSNKTVVKLQIWDTVGQEKFMSINKNLFLKVQGIIIMYDITDQNSFDHIPLWIKAIKEVNENTPLMLVANKCDRESERVISEEEGNKTAIKYNMSFAEASAKENINVDTSFIKLTEEVLSLIQKNATSFQDDFDQKSLGLRESFSYKKPKKKFYCFSCC